MPQVQGEDSNLLPAPQTHIERQTDAQVPRMPSPVFDIRSHVSDQHVPLLPASKTQAQHCIMNE